MNTERDDREQIEAIRKMMAEKEEKKRAKTNSCVPSWKKSR